MSASYDADDTTLPQDNDNDSDPHPSPVLSDAFVLDSVCSFF